MDSKKKKLAKEPAVKETSELFSSKECTATLKEKKAMLIKTAMPFAIVALLFCSCQMYRANFDCPPGKGIPCTSVTDIESMIIETPKGPDVLAGKETGTWKKMVPQLPPGEVRKVWLADTDTDCGCHIEGHYLYIYPQIEAK